ncbi:MAG: polysaccharide deacetylase family protein [Prolixibacteraceae bacterium]
MINFFSTELTPRIEYAFRLIFETILKDEISFYQSNDEFEKSVGVKINYSDRPELGGLYLRPHGLLHEHHIQIQYPVMIDWDGEKAFYPVEDSFLPFDLFAASFYLVSRYEEYITGKRDSHQRFRARDSFAAVHSFLEKPLVNIWALKLAAIIEEKYPDQKFKRSNFTYLPTFDIDNAWAFKHKSFFRTSASMLKDLLRGRWKLFKKRFAVVNRLDNDPYDNYDYMLETLHQYNFRAIYFFLLSNKGKHDRSISHRNLFYRNLILKLGKTGKLGIHPSYLSNRSSKQLAKEIRRLTAITGKEVKRSRQHFLKMSMPGTYRNLIANGIEADYSMCFPSRPGFRASIANSFYFFDVLKNETTTFKVHPFQVMDATLLHYRGMGVAEASRKIEQLMRETAKVGGTFVSLWHNESLSDEGYWKGWRNVYTEMTRLAAELRNERTTTAQ